MSEATIRDLQAPSEGHQSDSKSDKQEVFDMAIVGMGPAGLYTAWRLSKADPNQPILGRSAKMLRVALFDTMPEDRVGGRLCTQPLPGYPFLAELGGMRFRNNQLLVCGLIDALGLSGQVQSFDFEQHFYFLREKRLIEADFKDSSIIDPPYELTLDEQGQLPHEVIKFAILKILKSLDFGRVWSMSRERNHWGIKQEDLIKKLKTKDGFSSLTAKEWAVIKRFGEYSDESLLSEVGFWDLLQFELSSGAWHLAHDGLGYESIMGNWNAAIALPWFLTDFASTKASTLKKGMRSITDRLYEEVKSAANISIHHKYDLTGIELQDGDERLIRLQFSEDGNPTPKVVLTRSVVLALPKGALIRLNYSDQLISKASIPEGAPTTFDRRLWFSDLLHSVDGRALFKLFLGYPTPWWTKTPWWRATRNRNSIIHGKVNTDLPLRQVYYYSKDQWNEDRCSSLGISPDKDQHSMIMASYSDSHYIEFWSELAKEEGYRYRGFKPESRKLSSEDENVLNTFGAPLSMIIRAEHQLGLLHGKRVLSPDMTPRAEVGLYMEWSRPPYYAGWHSWKVGVKPWEICDKIMHPFGDENIFICGEAYSDEQGWTEGALKSAERLMTLVFRLPLPSEMLRSKFDSDNGKLKEYIDAFDG